MDLQLPSGGGRDAAAAGTSSPAAWRSRATWRHALLATAVFLLAAKLPDLFRAVGLYGGLRSLLGAHAFSVVATLQVGICIAALLIAHRTGLAGAVGELGLRAPFPRALGFALLVTLPMLAGNALTATLAPDPTWLAVLRMAAVGPFVEEVLFRGYLFRQLYDRASWSFWPAALFVALLFGLAHTWQAVAGNLGLGALAGIVGITAIGSVFFSWLYVRWGFNLWVPIAVHGLMNLWWELFAVDTTALGGTVANVARLLTLGAAIGVTLWLTRAPER